MRNDQYFPHDATAGNNIKLMALVEAEGARGYGVYWYLLEFLRQQAGYKGKLNMLDMLARRVKTTRAVVKRIVTDYALFVVEGELFYSPGLIERMQPLDHKRAAKSEQCRRAAGAKWLKVSNSNDAGAMQEEEKEKEEKRISSLNPSDSRTPRNTYSLTPTLSKGEGEEESRGRRKEEDGGGNFASTTGKEGIKPSPEYAYNKATHNLEGLQRSLDALGIREQKEVQAIMSLTDYGRLEGAIWKLLYHTKWSKIKQPARFLIAGLKKGI